MTASEDVALREIVNSRNFAAPCERVYEAFSNPDQLVNWWGPKGFMNTFKEFDFRPGGTWRFTMHGPDGTDYPNEKRFLEIAPLKRIVFEHRQANHHFRMTMIFTDMGGKTNLTWKMLFPSATDIAEIRGLVLEANEQNFDRLEFYLVTMA